MRSTQRTTRLLASLLATLACAAHAGAGPRIGILLWNVEPRYERCRDGFIEQLAKEGFKPPAVTFLVEQAHANRNTAGELARKLAAARLDLVVPLGTSAAVAVAEEIKDRPVVFGMVFDPVEAKIAADWKSSGNNTTGSSSKVPVARVVATLAQLRPVKRLAVLYTPGERNSEVQLHEFEALQKPGELQVIPAGLVSRADADVARVMERVNRSAEAVFLGGSAVVGDALPKIVGLAAKGHVVTVSTSGDHVDKGALLGVTVDSTAVGRLAGVKAAKVLRGAKPASLPIEALKTTEVLLNLKTAAATGVQVPAALKASASRLVE